MSSWLSKALGTNSLNHDFNYDPATANVAGMNFGNIANQMLSGEGSYFDKQRQFGSGQIQDAAYNAMHQQNMQLAQRGMGGGGLRDLLGATSGAQAGEQTSKFNLGLAGQGFQQASSFAGMGLQQAMANQSAQNQASEYSRTSQYNQDAGNRATKAQMFGNVMNLAGGLGASYMGAQFGPKE